jgi:hypothetical protein
MIAKLINALIVIIAIPIAFFLVFGLPYLMLTTKSPVMAVVYFTLFVGTLVAAFFADVYVG